MSPCTVTAAVVSGALVLQTLVTVVGGVSPVYLLSEENRSPMDGRDNEYMVVYRSGRPRTLNFYSSDEEVDTEMDQTIDGLGKGGLRGIKLHKCENKKFKRKRKICPSRVSLGNFRGLIVTIDSMDQLEVLRNLPRVEYVEQLGVGQGAACAHQHSPPYMLDHIDFGESETNTRNGRYYHNPNGGYGVRVYILDSGIRLSHVEYEGRAVWGATLCTSHGPCQHGVDVHGHGTAVAGIVGGKTYGVAKKSTLVAVKVLNDNDVVYWSDAIAGLNWVQGDMEDRQCNERGVINMSISGSKSNSFNDAVTATVNAGILVVTASGNANRDACNYSPGSASLAWNIGSLNNQSPPTKSSFSNYNSCVDLWAPGEGIKTTKKDSNTAFYYFSGTSAASPVVAGAAATYLTEHPAAPPENIKIYMRANAIGGISGSIGSAPNKQLQIGCPVV